MRNSPPSSSSQSLRLLQAAVESYGPLLTLEMLQAIAEKQGLNRSQVRNAVSGLGRGGWIEIVKRGVYLVRSPLFADEVHPFGIAVALAHPSAISHWSALAHHGFTTQLPRMVQVSTPVKVVTPEMRRGQAHRPRGRAVWAAGGVEVEFIHVSSERFWGHQSIWVNRWQQVAITDAERTALDVIARSDLFGGMQSALELLEGALPHIRVEQLINYALRYGEGATIKRLGWALERMGIPAQQLEPLQVLPVKTYYRLDPQQPPSRQHNARWHIIENLNGVGND
jgi:predicted transcriptional regulator of viral defense system